MRKVAVFENTKPKTPAKQSSTKETPAAPDSPDELEPIMHQTHFAEDVVIEDVQNELPDEATSGKQEKKSWWKNPKIILLIAVAVVAGILMILTVLLQQNMDNVPVFEPEETQNQEQQEQVDELKRQLLLLEKDIESADPLQAELAFPPITFDQVLEDALSTERLQDLQQERRTR